MLLDVSDTTLHVTSEQFDRLCLKNPDLRLELTKDRLLGVKLGLLVNLIDKQVEVYRLGQVVEILELPMSIDCSEVMPEFILNLAEIW